MNATIAVFLWRPLHSIEFDKMTASNSTLSPVYIPGLTACTVYTVQLSLFRRFSCSTACGSQVNSDGRLSFGSAIHGEHTPSPLPVRSESTPFIAPYWADVDTSRNNGRIYYRPVTGLFHLIPDITASSISSRIIFYIMFYSLNNSRSKSPLFTSKTKVIENRSKSLKKNQLCCQSVNQSCVFILCNTQHIRATLC